MMGFFPFNYGKTTALDFKFKGGRSNVGSCTEAWLPKVPRKVDDLKQRRSFDSNRGYVSIDLN